MFENMFIVGLVYPEVNTQITYHMDIDPYWELSNFIPELEKAPEWNGHTSNDVLEILRNNVK
jgi:hypothetical protein